MSFIFNCSYCNQKLKAEDEWVGRGAKCPTCGKHFIISKNKDYKSLAIEQIEYNYNIFNAPKQENNNIVNDEENYNNSSSCQGNNKDSDNSSFNQSILFLKTFFSHYLPEFINTKWMRVCAIICIIFIFWIFPSWGGCGIDEKKVQEWYDIGMTYYKDGDLSNAAIWLEKSAKAGNSNAQNMLGYENGHKPDLSHISFENILKIKKAQEWYNLGISYFNTRQFREAAHWLEQSADAVNLDAQQMLDYENGRKPDSSHISFETALQWKANYK